MTARSWLLFGSAASTTDVRRGLVRSDRSCLVDEGGSFLGVGASFFWLPWGFAHDRARLTQNLALLKGRVHFVRAFAVVGPSGGWDDRTVDPTDPEWDATIAGTTDLAYDEYGLRVEWCLFGGVDRVPSASQREQVVRRFAAIAAARPEKVYAVEVANEGWQTGFEGSAGAAELKHLARVLRDLIPNLVAPTSPQFGETDSALFYQGSRATMVTGHLDRRQNGTGGIWRLIRQPWEMHFWPGTPPVRFLDEPIGPQSSDAADDDPLRLTMLAAAGYVTGCASFTLHTGAGIRGGGAADVAKGRAANFSEVQNLDAILAGLETVSRNLSPACPNWSKQNGNERFPDYPFAWEPLKEDLVLRAYAALHAGGFVAVPMCVRGDVPFIAKRAMHVLVRDPLTWTELASSDLQPGGSVVLHGSMASPTAFILEGSFQ